MPDIVFLCLMFSSSFSHLCPFAGNNGETKHDMLKMRWTRFQLSLPLKLELTSALFPPVFIWPSMSLLSSHIITALTPAALRSLTESFWAVKTHCKLQLFSHCVTFFFSGTVRTISIVSMCKTPLSKCHLQVLTAQHWLVLLGREKTFNLFSPKEGEETSIQRWLNSIVKKETCCKGTERSNTMSFSSFS